MLKNNSSEPQEKSQKIKIFFFKAVILLAGIFLLGYGFIAMLFNFKIGLAIAILGTSILVYFLYQAYEA